MNDNPYTRMYLQNCKPVLLTRQRIVWSCRHVTEFYGIQSGHRAAAISFGLTALTLLYLEDRSLKTASFEKSFNKGRLSW